MRDDQPGDLAAVVAWWGALPDPAVSQEARFLTVGQPDRNHMTIERLVSGPQSEPKIELRFKILFVDPPQRIARLRSLVANGAQGDISADGATAIRDLCQRLLPIVSGYADAMGLVGSVPPPDVSIRVEPYVPGTPPGLWVIFETSWQEQPPC
jgi:hypothetical protein